MVIRQMKESKFTSFQEMLINKAEQSPLDASFQIAMTVNESEYILKLQPDSRRRVAALQVLEIIRGKEGIFHTLITDNRTLSALLEVLILQTA